MEAIYQVGGELSLVVTLEDSQAVTKSGRVYLDDFCTSNKIPLLKSSHINNNDCVEAIKKHEIDWLFIIGWSQIANSEILSAPLKGVLGIHPTLLPQGRGRASIPWAIIKGLKKTGVTLFKLDEGVDTGEIVDQKIIPLSETTTATHLYELVNSAHVDLMKTVFPKLQKNLVKPIMQDNKEASEWPGRVASDGEIDLDGSVHDAEKLVRAVTKPYPGAYIIRDQIKTIIWSAKIQKFDASLSEQGQLFKDGFLVFTDYEVML